MLKLKVHYFGHLMWRNDSLEKTLMLGKIEGRRRKGWQRMRYLDGSPTRWTWAWATPGAGEGQGSLECCSPWGRKELDKTEWLNWTDEIQLRFWAFFFLSHTISRFYKSLPLHWAFRVLWSFPLLLLFFFFLFLILLFNLLLFFLRLILCLLFLLYFSPCS